MEKVLVTISRQFGCGGAYLGQRIAKRLGIAYVDREILQEAARFLGEEESTLERREERLSTFWEKFSRVFMADPVYVPPSERPIYDRDLFNAETSIINEIADKGSAVIIGRGGFKILQGRRGLVNIFLHGAEDFRIRRVMEVYNKKEGEARSLVLKLDHDRSQFIRTMTGADWNDSRNYQLCLDISRTDFDTAEDLICIFIEGVKRMLEK